MNMTHKTLPLLAVLFLAPSGCLFHDTSLREFDAGSDVGDNVADTGTGTDTGPHKRIAFSVEGGPGQFLTSQGNIGGLAGADRFCQAGADRYQIGGTWKAWLSDSQTDAIDRIADVGPWYTMNGNLAFQNKAQLAGTPSNVIEYDMAGGIVASSSYWTGTNPGGTRAAENCNDWTSSSEMVTGVWGSGRETSNRWTTYVPSSICLQGLNLLCIEQ